MMLAPIDTTDKVYSITPSSMAVGAVSSLPGFRLGSGVTLGVRSETAYGTTANVFGANSGNPDFVEPLFETVASGRDVVVTTWSRIGHMFLRCDRAHGTGIRIEWNGFAANGELRVYWAKNIPSTPADIVPADGIYTTSLFQTMSIASHVTGWDPSSTAGDQYEFSLIGSVLTIKWNGQTVWTANNIWFCPPGTVLYAPGGASGAIRDTTITFKPSVARYTDQDNRIIDFRDWGWKELSTTGNMAANSTTLTVASAAGFSVGDRVIVEIGGEAGAGEKGTIGVGGTWPATRVPTAADLPDPVAYRAANGNTDAYIYVESENANYINYLNAGVPTFGEWTNYVLADTVRRRAFYHTIKLLPMALKATITAISGNTLTLDKAAEANTTDAAVYYDNTYVMDPVTSQYFTNAATGFRDVSPTKGYLIKFPPGKFCITKNQSFPMSDYWALKGEGADETVFYCPKGTEQVAFQMAGESLWVSDFTVQSWAGVKYYGTDSPAGYIDQQKYAIQIARYKTGVVVENINCINTWGGPKLDAQFDAVVRKCKGFQTNGAIQLYATWFFGPSYCVNTWYEDCEYYSDAINPAYEIFQANGGGFRRVKSVNGYCASNTSGGGWVMEDMDIYIDGTAKPQENDWVIEGQPVIDINTNIGLGAYYPGLVASGGTIRNPHIVVKKAASGVQRTPIAIQENCPDILIEGQYPSTAAGNKGLLVMEDYDPAEAAVTAAARGATGVISDANGTVVRGIRVIGTAQGEGFANINMRRTTSHIENCVADDITAWNGSAHVSVMGQNGNITNTAYDAL